MKTLSRIALVVLLGFVALGSATPMLAAEPSPPAHRAACTVPANRLFDYIRGNRSRMVQVATIGLGIGLVILMTATRKH